jgi:hypothetical protein
MFFFTNPALEKGQSQPPAMTIPWFVRINTKNPKYKGRKGEKKKRKRAKKAKGKRKREEKGSGKKKSGRYTDTSFVIAI